MPIVCIERSDDPRLAGYRHLSNPELVRARGLFIAEGRLVVQRLIEARRYSIESLLLNEAARRALEPTLAGLPPDVTVYLCDAADFVAVTGYNIHRGCLALARRPQPHTLDDVLRDARLVVVLEGVTNADNIGGVFRNAAAFGAGAVLLSPTCCDPLYRKAIRTSMAATLRVPYVTLGDESGEWPSALSVLHEHGFTIVALTPRPPSRDLEEFRSSVAATRLALLVGTEGAGLTAGAEAAADHRVRIAMTPEIDSLNLAVATGIALYRLARKGVGSPFDNSTP